MYGFRSDVHWKKLLKLMPKVLEENFIKISSISIKGVEANVVILDICPKVTDH